ncbi:hypothetical protein F5X98DRAFT_358738 [Xylaria grammica]|nr:hypothetical protein F5X98DRAFT_358738 [Xylaria grammica]
MSSSSSAHAPTSTHDMQAVNESLIRFIHKMKPLGQLEVFLERFLNRARILESSSSRLPTGDDASGITIYLKQTSDHFKRVEIIWSTAQRVEAEGDMERNVRTTLHSRGLLLRLRQPRVELNQPDEGFSWDVRVPLPQGASCAASRWAAPGEYPKFLYDDLSNMLGSLDKITTPFQGQIWTLSTHSRLEDKPQFTMSLELAALIGSFFLSVDPTYGWYLGLPLEQAFIHTFTNPSSSEALFKAHIFHLGPGKWSILALFYRLRYFVPVHDPQFSATLENGRVEVKLKGPRQENQREGLILHRQMAYFSKGNGFVYFCEKVTSLSLLLESSSGNPYILLELVDEGLESVEPTYGHRFKRYEEPWREYGLNPCGSQTGVGQLLVMVLLQLEEWEKGWIHTMDVIDSIVRVQLSDFLQEEHWSRSMFDDSFKLSRTYFGILQLLRIIDDWVESTVLDLKELRRQYTLTRESATPDDVNNLESNWKTVLEIAEGKAETIRNRVIRKTEDIKSLRDGLFNATSLREATKAIALNRAIYVFTIITVIYTPLGFLATFWALPFFSNPAETVPLPSAFSSTFIVIPIATYGLALAVAFYFGSTRAQKSAQTLGYIVMTMLTSGYNTLLSRLTSSYHTLHFRRLWPRLMQWVRALKDLLIERLGRRRNVAAQANPNASPGADNPTVIEMGNMR